MKDTKGMDEETYERKDELSLDQLHNMWLNSEDVQTFGSYVNGYRLTELQSLRDQLKQREEEIKKLKYDLSSSEYETRKWKRRA